MHHIRNCIRSFWEYKFIRFACVGVINTCDDLAVLNVLIFTFGLRLLEANIISAVASITISYFLNHLIVFRRQHEMSAMLFIRFFAVTGLSVLLVQSGVLYVMEHVLSLHTLQQLAGFGTSKELLQALQVNISKLTAVLAGMVWNFALYHMVVFRDEKQAVISDEGVVPY